MARYVSTLLQDGTYTYNELITVAFNFYTYIYTSVVSCRRIEGAGWVHILLSSTVVPLVFLAKQDYIVLLFPRYVTVIFFFVRNRLFF